MAALGGVHFGVGCYFDSILSDDLHFAYLKSVRSVCAGWRCFDLMQKIVLA